MERELAELIGVNVKRLRRERGFSQEVLGERSGVDFKYVGAVERGETNFTVAILAQLARGLEIEPYRLLLPIGGTSGAATSKKSGDLYTMLADLDQRGAIFLRDVMTSYLANRAEPSKSARKR